MVVSYLLIVEIYVYLFNMFLFNLIFPWIFCFILVTSQETTEDLPVAALTKEQLQQALLYLIKVCYQK